MSGQHFLEVISTHRANLGIVDALKVPEEVVVVGHHSFMDTCRHIIIATASRVRRESIGQGLQVLVTDVNLLV